MRKRETHIVKGMSRDMSVHRFDPNLVIDARNIRITTIKDSGSLLSVTNEKGTREFTVNGTTPIKGTIIGTAVLNDLLILFTTDSDSDRIYRLKFNSDFTSATNKLLFPEAININKSLGFSVDHPLETLPIYENEDIQKVYWVDGINQPRMINVAGDTATSNEDMFNFNRKIEGKHKMEITKFDSGGEFPAGTIQYCFNYFNKFAQETNIVDVSPMYYLCPKDTGLPADAISICSFSIKLSDLDSSYEYVRLYAITRTSENAVPNVRVVGDYRINPLRYVTEGTLEENDIVVDFSNLCIVNTETGSVIPLDPSAEPSEGDSYEVRLDVKEYLLDTSTNTAYWYYTSPEAFQTSGIYRKLPYINVRKSSGECVLRSTRAGDLLSGDYIVEQQHLTITDNGIVGSTLDATALLFIGGQNIIAGTLTSKDNTLFLGNIKQNVPNAGSVAIGNSDVKTEVRGCAEPCIFNYGGQTIETLIPTEYVEERYVSGSAFFSDHVDNNRSSYDIKGFKARENYRLGFIAQYNTGQWSEAIWIDDLDETYAPGRNVFYSTRQEVKWGPHYRKPGFKAELPLSVVSALIGAGFVRVAPVVVYPKDADRIVLFQGLLFGTVFNVNDRADNSPFAQADWRARCGYSWNNILGEIQCNPFGYGPNLPAKSLTVSESDFVDRFSTEYYRDPSILSFYSPDIESIDDLYQSDMEGLSMRIVGISNAGFDDEKQAIVPDTIIDTFLNTSTQGFDAEQSTVLSFSSGSEIGTRRGRSQNTTTTIDTRLTTGETDLSYAGYLDIAVTEDENGKIVADDDTRNLYKWTTYLWHRNGSMNNQAALSAKAQSAGSIRYAMLNKKCISEIKYARTTFFQNNTDFQPFDVEVPINTPQLFDSNQVGMEKFDAGNDSGLFYYGNIDKVITANFNDLSGIAISSAVSGITHGYDMSDGYPIGFVQNLGQELQNSNIINYTGGRKTQQAVGNRVPRDNDGSQDGFLGKGKDPISMKYKTVKHLVVGLDSTSENVISQLGTAADFTPFWRNDVCIFDNVLAGKLDDTIDEFSGIYNGIFVAEMYRKFSDQRMNARFGGASDNAIQNNIWVRCGESVYLHPGVEALMYYREGDTYVGRYDCLKSYPFTDEDQNQIVSIYSTELESRVNLDARYDKNKGLSSNLYMRPTNFNLFNHPGYEQSNQYFTYKAIDYDRYTFDKYPNMLTWSVEKRMGADIDSWTSIPMTSTADVQGDLGEITKLETFNDTLFSFQRRGIAQVLFNSRVQIPTSDGQPIEITNGFKFGGLRYITNQIGLTNKWSFCTTPNGMYFVDDEKNTLYIFNGQQLQDLSSKYGFRTWFSAIDSHDIWNPSDYNNLRTFYDKVNGDLYFMTDEESLVFSEQLGTFTSFMDYMGLPAMVNVNDRFLTFTKNLETGMVRTWEMFAGDFNDFFGTLKPYWITFVSNTDPTVDKVYDNLAWRTFEYSDVTDDFQGNIQPLKTFNSLRVWNDHQDTGEVALYDQNGNMNSVLKKKFNVFRTYIPRDKYGNWKGKGLNRIRNTWSYIRLSKVNPGTDLLMFSDLDVDFFE